jgi:transcriptional regulator with XRE-family HTH domain
MTMGTSPLLAVPLRISALLRREGISRVDLVRRLGFRDQRLGLRHLDGWLSGSRPPHGDQVEQLARVLGVSDRELIDTIQRDERALYEDARQRRALDPRCRLTIRAAVPFSRALCAELTEERAIMVARSEARRLDRRCCLNTPTSRNYWLNPEGEIEAVTEGAGPFTVVGARVVRLSMDR